MGVLVSVLVMFWAKRIGSVLINALVAHLHVKIFTSGAPSKRNAFMVMIWCFGAFCSYGIQPYLIKHHSSFVKVPDL